jgi:hypothetical protein
MSLIQAAQQLPSRLEAIDALTDILKSNFSQLFHYRSTQETPISNIDRIDKA